MQLTRRDILLLLAASKSAAQTISGIMLGAAASATNKIYDWYVDSVSGNDSQDGKSPATAFATVAHLQAQTIVQGQTIGFYSQGYWREQFNPTVSTVSNVTVSGSPVPVANLGLYAYGPNLAPVAISAGAWTNTSGNVYQCSLSTTGFIRATEGGHALASGGIYPLLPTASVAACQSIPGSYYSTGSVLYVHATDGSNPASSGLPYFWQNHPMLDCCDVIPFGGIGANTWSKTGGLTNVYQITVSFPADSVSNAWATAWENGTQLLRASSAANCDTIPGSMFITGDYGTNLTLYVNAAGGSKDPSSNGQVYEYNQRSFGIDTYGYAYVSIYGLATQRNKGNDGSTRLGPFGYVNGTVHCSGGKHNLYFRTGANLVGALALGSYYAGGSAECFIGNENSPNSEGLSLANCQAVTTAISQEAYNNHTNVSGTFGTVTYTGCFYSAPAANGGVAFNGASSFINCDSLNAATHISAYGPCSISGGTSQSCTGAGGNSVIYIQGGSGAVTIDGVSAFGGSAPFLQFLANTISSITITRCVLSIPYVGADFNYYCVINSTGEQPTTLTFGDASNAALGNTVYALGVVNRQMFHFNASPGTIVSNNNTFIAGGGSWQWKLGSTFYTQAQWLGLGYEANSSFT